MWNNFSFINFWIFVQFYEKFIKFYFKNFPRYVILKSNPSQNIVVVVDDDV